jgi:lipopolysaccharide transport system ATP-binding protein
MDYYNALLADHQNQTVKQEVTVNGKIQTVSGTGEATLTDIALLNTNGQRLEVVDVGQAVTLQITVKTHAFVERLVLGYGIKDRFGQIVFGTNTDLKKQVLENVPSGANVRFDIAFPANLGPGTYSVQTALASTDTHLVNNYEWRDLALVFNVININKPHFAGVAWIDPNIEITKS